MSKIIHKKLESILLDLKDNDYKIIIINTDGTKSIIKSHQIVYENDLEFIEHTNGQFYKEELFLEDDKLIHVYDDSYKYDEEDMETIAEFLIKHRIITCWIEPYITSDLKYLWNWEKNEYIPINFEMWLNNKGYDYLNANQEIQRKIEEEFIDDATEKYNWDEGLKDELLDHYTISLLRNYKNKKRKELLII